MTISQSLRILLTLLAYILVGDAEMTRFSGELSSYNRDSVCSWDDTAQVQGLIGVVGGRH